MPSDDDRGRANALEYERRTTRAPRTLWFRLTGDARRPAFWPAFWGELWPTLLLVAFVAASVLTGCDRRGRPPPPMERRVEIAGWILAVGVPAATIGAALWAWAAVRVGEIFARWMMRSLIVALALSVAAFAYVRYLR